MKLIAISDTHEKQDQITLPEGDVLIHAGDWTYKGDVRAIEKFLTWFISQPHKHKIAIAGNHELGLNRGPRVKEKQDVIKSFVEKNENFHYLENSSVVIDGVKFYGSPASPFFHDWEFNYMRGEEISQIWKLIENDTNVLITHSPPMGILDAAPRGFGSFENVGCKDLLKTIDERLNDLKVHIFGHIHRDNNEDIIERNGIKFCNASILDNQYKIANNPLVIDI